MFFRNAFFLLAPIASAAATPLNSRGTLAHDDVIVVGNDGSTTVMKDYEYDGLKARAENAAKTARSAALPPRIVPASSQSLQNGKRGCEESSETQVLTDETFLNWDVPMSSVIGAQGGDASVSITSGYSISNSLSVGVTADETLIADVLSLSFSVSYTQTWTTEASTSYTFSVPDGQYGLIVSEPSVRRMTGYYLSGCTDSPTKDAFTSDTYSSQTFDNLNWVSGVIRLCNSSSYPVPYCVGTGTHS